jgi:hypothetical protein
MYRGVIVPARGLQAVLDGLTKRVMALERRIRWPGATQIAQSSGVPIASSLLPDYTPLVTITLDPGRWVVLAGANIEQDSTANYAITVNITGTDLSAQADYTGVYLLGGTTVPMTTFSVLSLAVETTIAFEARYTAFSGDPSVATANDVYLIATPT